MTKTRAYQDSKLLFFDKLALLTWEKEGDWNPVRFYHTVRIERDLRKSYGFHDHANDRMEENGEKKWWRHRN